ncbi:MAG: 4-alpha-glucanotransferase, partial [Bacteroidetes bacterium QS_8_68_15]
MHITSLPGRFGIGDLGPAAHRFVDFLEAGGLSLWQILPLGATGDGASPYTTTSTFAGNPLLISPDRLHEAGLVTDDDLDAAAVGEGRVDYPAVRERKTALLETAFTNVEQGAFPDLTTAFDAFREKHGEDWLNDYALFAALHEAHDHASWTQWAVPLRDRDPEALRRAREGHARA